MRRTKKSRPTVPVLQMRKHTSGEEQNVKKVAKLLAVGERHDSERRSKVMTSINGANSRSAERNKDDGLHKCDEESSLLSYSGVTEEDRSSSVDDKKIRADASSKDIKDIGSKVLVQLYRKSRDMSYDSDQYDSL